jgi:hypothetical protein
MRGKLRDKRITAKSDQFKRDMTERKRPTKRDNKTLARWLHQQIEEQSDVLDADDEAALAEPPKKL